VTDRFDDMLRFYGSTLNFPRLEGWDRPNGRGQRFDLGGCAWRFSITRESAGPCSLSRPDRFHIVVEVGDLLHARSSLGVDTPAPTNTSWHARLFQIRDPDGVAVTFLEWDKHRDKDE
jgi:hypothetical protein